MREQVRVAFLSRRDSKSERLNALSVRVAELISITVNERIIESG